MTVHKLLLIDDEVNILNSLRRLLLPENFEITATESPFEALHLASKEDFTIVMSDQRMPHMEGTTLLNKIKEISPSTIRILLTGYADMNAATAAINEGEVYRFLPKPWDDEDLIKVLKQAVKQFELTYEEKKAASQNQQLLKQNQSLTEKNTEQLFRNKNLSQELNQSYLITINALTQSMKLYDLNLWRHAICAKQICHKVAQLISLSKEQTTQLEVAALLQNIGQTGIPQALLMKPDSDLKPEELQMIKSHPFNGYSIVSMIPAFQDAATFILYHHEQYDGNGYPEGLKSHAIPASARILAVINTYVESKKGPIFEWDKSAEQVFENLESQKGIKFDPDAVSLLKECIYHNEKNEKTTAQQNLATLWQEKIKMENISLPLTSSLKPADDPSELISKQVDSLLMELQSPNAIPPKNSSNKVEISGHFEARSNEIQSLRQSEPETLEIIPSSLEQSISLGSKQSQEELQFLELPTWDIGSLNIEQLLGGTLKTDSNPVIENSVSPITDSSQPVSSTRHSVKSSFTNNPLEDLEVKRHSPPLSLSPKNQGNFPTSRNVLKQAYTPAKSKRYREVAISPDYLCGGMVLSRDLISSHGVKLLQKGAVILPNQVEGIKSFLLRNDLSEIYIITPY